ncbi:hypothetical protein DYB32_001919 [Aphanomyces invadans]|uniref:Transmembrane protein n=1 Tax=Aphanomyces invadans TaxID=157072 RepID=A0A3R7ADA0_9STRA|nr:hypothetical protein DYB32_001919 [Aphanomyces invadans]
MPEPVKVACHGTARSAGTSALARHAATKRVFRMITWAVGATAAYNMTIGVVGATIAPGCLSTTEQGMYFALPYTALVACTVYCRHVFSSFVAVDMVEEKSESVGAREATRNTWTTAGVINALMFTTIQSVLFQCPTDDKTTLLSVWYVGKIWFASGWSIIGICESSLYLMYTDPLGDADLAQFIQDNPKSIGLPTVDLALSLLLTVSAVSLWFYGRFGCFLGIVLNILWPMAIMTIVNQWRKISLWHKRPTTRSDMLEKDTSS